MANPAIAKIGVEAVVAGLSSFLGNMGKIDKSITGLKAPTNILGSTFSWLGGIVNGLVGGALRTLEYTLGNLLASAIQSVVGWLKELGAGVLESADTFQKLELRLQRLNFNAARDSGLEYNEAMKEAARLTKEQLDWTLRLGAQTPYDAKDVADIYTLARGYGFSADEAEGLTESIIDFTAGMGLSNVELERIIINFGQLRQQGKLNNQDLRDLARGAFVPINKIIAITAEKLGITVDEFNDLKKSGKLSADAVDLFRQSFQDLVGTDFEGASVALGNVFSVARENVEGLIRDMLGLHVVGPVLLTIGTHIQDMTNALTDNDDRWNSLTDSLKRIGASAMNIVSRILELGPSAEDVADRIVSGLDNIATWLESNEDVIVAWVQDAVKWLRDDLLPSIAQVWDFLFGTEAEDGAIQKFGAWLKDDLVPWVEGTAMPIFRDLIDLLTGKFDMEEAESPLAGVLDVIAAISEGLPEILDLFGALGEVIAVAFGGDETKSFAETIREDVVPAIADLAKWVSENKELLAGLLKAFLALEVIVFIVGIVMSIIGAIVSFIATVALLSVITVIVGGVVLAFKWMQLNFELAKNALFAVIDSLVRKFNEWKENVSRTFNELANAIRNKDWAGAGQAVIDGIWRGIQNNYHRILDLVRSVATQALNSFKSVFGIQSPSVEMEIVGENIVKGLSAGIANSAALAVKSMKSMAGAVMTPAMQAAAMSTTAMPTNSVTHNTTNAYNLSINTNAPTENVIQDFNMMESLS